MADSEADLIKFCRELPKIELHAHLTGSIRPETLREVWLDKRQKDPGLELGDPVEVLSDASEKMDAVTFFPLFSKFIYRLCNTAEYISLCTRAVLADFAADGVSYLELRTIPRPAEGLSKEEYVELVLSVIKSQPSHLKPKSAYLILGVDRKYSPAEARETVELAIKYRNRGVVGVDLAGNPARGAEKVLVLAEAFSKAKGAGLGVTLHFAELKASATDAELKALLAYQPDRLGHVIKVPDWAKAEIRRRKLGLELCLTCNVTAKLIDGGYENHHFGEWRHSECPIAICTDDCGIFGSGTSNEWRLLIEHFKLSKQQAVTVCQSGIKSVFGTEQDKDRLRREIIEFTVLQAAEDVETPT